MKINGRLVLSLVLILGFFYLLITLRTIFTPLIVAAIFAYVFNPVALYFERRAKIPRGVSAILIYLILIGVLTLLSIWIVGSLFDEAKALISGMAAGAAFNIERIQTLPDWQFAGLNFGLKTLTEDFLASAKTFGENFGLFLFPFFASAIERIFSILIFLISSFYLLKDGPKIAKNVIDFFPASHRKEVSNILSKINETLAAYLRGQLILIVIMSFSTWVALTILGIQFSLFLALLTGFLEIIPFFGPILATAIAAFIAFLTETNRFGLDPLTLSAMIIIIYFVLRHVEDYFVIPQVLGRVTRLHPLIVLFSVLVGGRIAGPLGFILAVPAVATLKILLEYSREKLK